VQSAANRQVTRAAVPFGLGYVTQPIVNTITDPTRRGAAVRGFQGLARDLDRPIDFGALGRNTIDAAGRGLANAPAAVVNMATHLPEMARSLTYGPIEDEENAQRRLDMARLQGDQSGVQSNANEANTQTANNTINFATSAFGPGVAAAKAGQATTRGLPLLFQQMGHSGAVGAGFAGANAALTTPGGLEDRLPAAVEALPGGFATGAVMPVAVNGFSALGSLAQRALPRRGGSAPPAAPTPQAPPGGAPQSPPREIARAADGSVLPVRPAEPFRQSHVGGSEDLLAAARPQPPGPSPQMQSQQAPPSGGVLIPRRTIDANVRGRNIQVLVNPTRADLMRMTNVPLSSRNEAWRHDNVRFIRDRHGNVFVAPGADTIHDDIAMALRRDGILPDGYKFESGPNEGHGGMVVTGGLRRRGDTFEGMSPGVTEDTVLPRRAAQPQMQGRIPPRSPQMGDNAGVRQEQMRGAIPESELLPIRAEPIDSQYVNLHVTTPGGGRGLVQVRLGGDYVRILKSHIYPETERGRGYGTRMYASVLDWASSNGYKRVLSDGRLSPDSQRIYPALQREGYNVQKKRSATTRLDQSGYPEVFSSGNRSIYSVQAERASPQQQSSIPRQYPQMPAKPQPQFGMTFAPPNGQFYSNPIPLPRRTGGGSRPPMRNVTPPGPPPIPEQGRLNSLARRSRRSVTQIEADIASERANPQGRRVVDLFGAPGVSALRPMVQAPGRTEALAVDAASQRFQAAPERIVGSLRRHLRVGESRQAAMRRLEREYQTTGADLYNPMFERPMEPAAQARAAAYVHRIADDPVMQDAQTRAQRIFDRDRRNGVVQGGMSDNYARALHYMKMGLDDASKFASNPTNGIGATELRGIREMRSQFVNMMDETIPGYRDARQRWGGLASAEDALEEGAGFWKLPSDEVQQRVAEMTPFELEHARIGMAHELEQKIGLAGSTTGNLNVANIQALRSPEMQRRLRAVFRTPEEAAAFFGDTSKQNELMRNSAKWIGGSTTHGNQQHGNDGAIQTAMELGGAALHRGPAGVVSVGARKIANAAFNNAVEHSNDRFGEVLLNDMSDQQWTEEFLNILRSGEARANTNTRTSRVAAAATGAQTGRNKRP
jgi:GNAT superfamily N-acetyltransferase